MVIIKHHSATFTVQPEHAESTRELLALIDKSKGRKGRKLSKGEGRGNSKHDSMKRHYPAFQPGMSTREYLRQYATLNARVHLLPVSDAFDHDRPAPMLDPSIPEVEELLCEQ